MFVDGTVTLSGAHVYNTDVEGVTQDAHITCGCFTGCHLSNVHVSGVYCCGCVFTQCTFGDGVALESCEDDTTISPPLAGRITHGPFAVLDSMMALVSLQGPPWTPLGFRVFTPQQPAHPRRAVRSAPVNPNPAGTAESTPAPETEGKCPVCWEEGKRKRAVWSCGHMLCEGCIRGMMVSGTTMRCPLCRADI